MRGIEAQSKVLYAVLNPRAGIGLMGAASMQVVKIASQCTHHSQVVLICRTVLW